MAEYQRSIRKCSQMLVGQTSDENAGRYLNAPLLNVFLGKDAEAHQEDVQDIYDGCWINGRDNIQYLMTDGFDADAVEDAVNRMRMIPRAFKTTSSLVQAVYWDIMDDRFDQVFDQVKVPYLPPHSIADYDVLYFIFLRQATRQQRQVSQQRLERLIDWAQSEGKHLLVLSDDTDQVLLNDESIVENYRIAADIVLIANSYTPITEKPLGSSLLNDLRKYPVFSAGYFSVRKDTYSIATVSLRRMLMEYEELSHQRDGSVAGVQEKLCGGGTYQKLFDDCFDQLLLPLLPKETDFLRYLPYTEPVQRLGSAAATPPPSQGGFLSGFLGFGKKAARPQPEASSDGLAAEIMASSPIYAACISMYYEQPVQQWLQSEAGEGALRRFFQEQLSLSLSYMEMSTYLLEEAAALEELAQKRQWKASPLPQTAALEVLVNACAVQQLRQALYPVMADCLADEMRRINRVAAGFDDTIRRVTQNLSAEAVDEGLESAYGSLMSRVCRENRELLQRKIRPCGENELLEQLTEVFAGLIERYPEYSYSLEQDLNFQLHNAAVSAASGVIDNCFSQDMAKTRHLQTMRAPEGHSYCMLNGSAGFLREVDPYVHGDVFMVQRSDYIERLFLYRVYPNSIIY